MKKVDKPHDSGCVDFLEATQNKKLSRTFPHLLRFGFRAERLARHYDAAQGHPDIIRLGRISELEKSAVLYLYDSPPVGMTYIKNIRQSLAGETCPMCGGFNPTELDHYLPKAKFPEYAWLSFNLVPACSCNRKRGETLFDAGTGARVLHPYYDNCLSKPLMYVKFDPNDASIGLEVAHLLKPRDPDFLSIVFHINEIVLKNNFIPYFSKRWEKLKVKPDSVLPYHARYRTNDREFRSYLVNLCRLKSGDGGPNCWEAIFLRSISRKVVSDWLLRNT